jgi:hypothetical protein
MEIWTDGVAQVVDCLPSKHEVLSSNPSITKKKKKSFIFPQSTILGKNVNFLNYQLILRIVN